MDCKTVQLRRRRHSIGIGRLDTGGRSGRSGHGRNFVTPYRVYGPDAGRLVPYIRAISQPEKWQPRGSLRRWRRWLKRVGKGNPLVIFAVCLAFAGPLLDLLGLPAVGFMLVGPSSTGKSTLIVLAGSVWGGLLGARLGFAETWLKTAEAFDKVIERYRDGFLGLDETKLAGRNDRQIAEVVADVLFRLATGVTKERFHDETPIRQGGLVYLASSNKTLAGLLAATETVLDPSYAVRLIEMPISGPHGVFDRLPEGSTGSALAEEIIAKAGKYHGTAIDQYLEQLVAERSSNQERLIVRLKGWMETMRHRLRVDGHSGVEARVAQFFCLVYAAGRLARKMGILPWSSNTIAESVEHCYRAHCRHMQAQAGAFGSVAAVRDYIQKQRHSFIDVRQRAAQMSDEEFENASGFITATRGQAFDFSFSPKGFHRMFNRNGNLKPVVEALRKANLLKHDADKFVTKRQIRAGKRRDRVYCVSSEIS